MLDVFQFLHHSSQAQLCKSCWVLIQRPTALTGAATVGGRPGRHRRGYSSPCCCGLLAAAVARAGRVRCKERDVSAAGGSATPAGRSGRGPCSSADCASQDAGQVPCATAELHLSHVKRRQSKGPVEADRERRRDDACLGTVNRCLGGVAGPSSPSLHAEALPPLCPSSLAAPKTLGAGRVL